MHVKMMTLQPGSIKLSRASIYHKYVYDRITVLRNLEVKIAHEDDDDATTGTLSYQEIVFMTGSRNWGILKSNLCIKKMTLQQRG